MEKERLLFKFYKSYWDVACELDDKNRLSFYDAIMNKQFNGIEPNLKGMAKFAYISQKHSIDAQVKGWEDKMKIELTPIAPPCIPPVAPPSIQLKEEEKEEEKEQYTILDFAAFWKMYGKSSDKKKCEEKYSKLNEFEREQIVKKLPVYLSTIKDKQFQKNPLTYLNGKCWNDIEEEQDSFNFEYKQPIANSIKF